jgi:hypothetical protein
MLQNRTERENQDDPPRSKADRLTGGFDRSLVADDAVVPAPPVLTAVGVDGPTATVTAGRMGCAPMAADDWDLGSPASASTPTKQ